MPRGPLLPLRGWAAGRLIQEDVGRLMSRADVNGTGALTGGRGLGAPART